MQVYNRTSLRLKSSLHRNPPSQWIRCADALPAIVCAGEGQRAAEVRACVAVRIAWRFWRAYARFMRGMARSVWRLASAPGMPGWQLLRRVFGSLPQACARPG
jgi:hypothetical protein